ncbi:histidine-type phosphatase [Acetobacter persici]|uniref:histidine-type phosphatase n=1 Tax=Acetobacter persici TaxID=1076596 RepID=UPI001FCB5D36|nr:histidine-type phosphatase [Acetobacter persici]
MLSVRFLSCLILASCAASLTAPFSAHAEPAQAAAPSSGAVLEKVLLVSRHGIRSPTKPLSTLEKQTGRVWSVWPVPPGELTDHGRADLALMGTFLHHWYTPLITQSSTPCASAAAIFVWADAADNRTRQSGDILSHALTQGCTSTAHSLPAGQHDPLFNALAAGQARLDQQRVMPPLTHAFQQATTPGSPEANAEAALQAAFAPAGCQQPTRPCFSAPAVLSWKKDQPHTTGGLTLSSSTAENLMLEYVQGLPSTAFANAALTPEDKDARTRQLLATVLPAHALLSDRLRRLPAIVVPRGHILAEALLESLTDNPVPLPDGSALPPSARLILFAGHDTTLDMLATLFGLDWSFTDQPDRTAPDTTLAFELWRLPDGQKDVRFRVFHQSLEQLRLARPIRPQAGEGAPLLLHSRFCSAATQTPCSPEALALGQKSLTE